MGGDDKQTLAGCKLLVVEDHPQSLELLRDCLEVLEGVEVLSATDGVSAVQLAETQHPDLILLDVMMPRMSGFEVCRRLKEQPSTRDIAVILVTALDAPADLERAAECRADEYLTKPFARNDLLNRVRRLLVLQRQRRAVHRAGGPTEDPRPGGKTAMTREDDLLSQPVHAFLDHVADREPTPGGGSVAAVAGVLGTALGRMVAAYSLGKHSGDEAAQVSSTGEHLARADGMLRQLVNEDAAAYRAYAAARKGGGASEKAQATGLAIAVPLEIAAVAVAALRELDGLKTRANLGLVSDLGIAAVLAEACVQAALYNVRVNVRDAAQADPHGEIRAQADQLLRHAREARAAITAFVDQHL